MRHTLRRSLAEMLSLRGPVCVCACPPKPLEVWGLAPPPPLSLGAFPQLSSPPFVRQACVCQEPLVLAPVAFLLLRSLLGELLGFTHFDQQTLRGWAGGLTCLLVPFCPLVLTRIRRPPGVPHYRTKSTAHMLLPPLQPLPATPSAPATWPCLPLNVTCCCPHLRAFALADSFALSGVLCTCSPVLGLCF